MSMHSPLNLEMVLRKVAIRVCVRPCVRLLRTLSKARRLSALHTRALDFFPEGYVLPQDHDSFQWQAKAHDFLKPLMVLG